MGNDIDYISSEEHFEINKPGELLIYINKTVNFCSNIWILSRDQVPLISKFYLSLFIYVATDKVLNSAALNVIWNLVAAQRFEYDDAEMLKLIGK